MSQIEYARNVVTGLWWNGDSFTTVNPEARICVEPEDKEVIKSTYTNYEFYNTKEVKTGLDLFKAERFNYLIDYLDICGVLPEVKTKEGYDWRVIKCDPDVEDLSDIGDKGTIKVKLCYCPCKKNSFEPQVKRRLKGTTLEFKVSGEELLSWVNQNTVKPELVIETAVKSVEPVESKGVLMDSKYCSGVSVYNLLYTVLVNLSTALPKTEYTFRQPLTEEIKADLISNGLARVTKKGKFKLTNLGLELREQLEIIMDDLDIARGLKED